MHWGPEHARTVLLLYRGAVRGAAQVAILQAHHSVNAVPRGGLLCHINLLQELPLYQSL